jgi:hypothetical protein
MQGIAEPELAILVFDDRSSTKRTVAQVFLRDPGKGLPVIAASAEECSSEPEIAMAVLENTVNVIRTVFSRSGTSSVGSVQGSRLQPWF